MTPAEELAAAADKLDALIAGAAPDWRVVDDNTLALPMIEMPAMIGLAKTSRTYTVAGPNDATTLYIAAMNPLVGADLFALLREFAGHVERRWRDFHEMWNTEQRVRMIGDHAPGLHAMLRIARLINRAGETGGES